MSTEGKKMITTLKRMSKKRATGDVTLPRNVFITTTFLLDSRHDFSHAIYEIPAK